MYNAAALQFTSESRICIGMAQVLRAALLLGGMLALGQSTMPVLAQHLDFLYSLNPDHPAITPSQEQPEPSTVHNDGWPPVQRGRFCSGTNDTVNCIRAPKAVYAPDPELSEEARRAGFGGTVILSLIVGPDGMTHNVKVARSLGLGLDEKAIEAIQQWKFEPAMKDGKPVAVAISIEVTFRRPIVGQQQPEFVRQGQDLIRQGKPEEALALYRQQLQTSPQSVPAHIAAGSVLDLMGKGEEARKYFAKAIEIADTPERKAGAQRAMAMSYAFEGDCHKTIEYEQQAFDYYGTAKNFFQQGEIADEAARVCIEVGDLDAAYEWYKIGHDTGLKEPDIKPARQDLWNFRWEHAQARIAARRGEQSEAQKHAAEAKAILDRGTIPEQAQFFPYLKGYVAFYAGDYKTALEELNRANQTDPFIQCLVGQTYEKLGDKAKALRYYQMASTASAHNPAAAYAVPFARKRLSLSPTSLRVRDPRSMQGHSFFAVFTAGSGPFQSCSSANAYYRETLSAVTPRNARSDCGAHFRRHGPQHAYQIAAGCNSYQISGLS